MLLNISISVRMLYCVQYQTFRASKWKQSCVSSGILG